MVARLSDFPANFNADMVPALSNTSQIGSVTSAAKHKLAVRGQLLLERAGSLADVRAGEQGIPGFTGTSLHLQQHVCRSPKDSFIRDRVFAVIADDGSICLRLPEEIAEDLIENGLCMRAGKNLLTWPIENEYQLEVSWRILLQAYWKITGTSAKRARRMWSEYVIQH